MDIWHWWFGKLVIAQILYLIAVIAGMRALKQWRLARGRTTRTGASQATPQAALGSPVPFQKS